MHPEKQRQTEQDRRLDRNDRDRKGHHGAPLPGQHVKIDSSANRNEKQAQQQPLERLDIRFQLVPEFTVGQHHTGQEGTQRRRQVYQAHESSNPDYQHQSSGREHFAQT